MSLSHRFDREDAQRAAADAFETFWRAYPRRVGKGEARRKFEAAARKASLQTMLEAIELYKAHKPAWMDFKHPATWLHQECWDDEWEAQPVQTGKRTLADAAADLLREQDHARQITHH